VAGLTRPTVWGALALALVALAFAARLGYVAATPDYVLVHDARDYDVHARSIAEGHGFSSTYAHGRPTAFRPPGYPFFLAGVYRLAGVERAPVARRLRAARFAQVLVGTAIVALVGVLAAQLWGGVVALVALALGAAYLPLILVGGAVMSEPLFDALMLAALAAAVQHRRGARRYRWALLAGALAGLAILTRANALVLLLPLAWAVWDGRPWRSWRALGPPLALVAVALAVLVPWTVRNAQVLHHFVPVSTQLGSALAGTYNDQAAHDRENPASWRSIDGIPAFAPLWRRIRATNEAEFERRLRSQSLRYAADHPTYVAKVAWWNSVRMLDLAGLRRSRATAATISVERTWADAGVACFWAFAALALVGALTRRARRAPAYVWAVPALMFLSVVFLVVETPRYRTAIDPFVVLLAALALVGGWRRLAGTTRYPVGPHAEDEDPQRRQEARQAHQARQAAPPPHELPARAGAPAQGSPLPGSGGGPAQAPQAPAGRLRPGLTLPPATGPAPV
jgi:4-amino-4-deoxy-L-arabinose transferase-like glycosyltransferase